MNKNIFIIICFLFIFNNLYANNDFFVNKNFTAIVKENSEISKNKKEKIYEMKYLKDKLEIKILEPEINKGETYIYTEKEKTIFYPLLNQTIKQKLENSELSLFNILKDIRKIEKLKTQKIDQKEYIFEKSLLKKIKAKNYEIDFSNYSEGKPREITYNSKNDFVKFKLDYK